MKKKSIMLLVAIIGIISLMIAGSAGEPAVLAKQDEVKEKGVTKWVGQTDMGSGDHTFASAQRMCEAITTASDGRLRLTVEPADEPEAILIFDAVHEGDIDFGVSHSAFWTDKFPAALLFCTRCGGMSPMAKYLWFISGEGAKLAQEMIDDQGDQDYNVHLVPGGGYLGPPYLFLHSKEPVENVAALEGLTIRSNGDEAAILGKFSDNVTWLPGGEIYDALRCTKEMEERGDCIDAFTFYSPYVHWQMGFHEVADYVYVSGCLGSHVLSQFIVNETSWNELPDDLKEIVQQVSNVEAITSYDERRQLDIAFLAAFQGYGCVVETLLPEIEWEFLQAAKQYYNDQAAGDDFYAKVLNSLRDFGGVIDNFSVEAITSYDEQCQGIYYWGY